MENNTCAYTCSLNSIDDKVDSFKSLNKKLEYDQQQHVI